jgi:alpha-tubulin suppressor-like RCC1 family protein
MKRKLIIYIFLIASLALPVPMLAQPTTNILASPQSRETFPQALPTFVKIAAGGSHTCALTAEGGVKCWGSNRDGELGDGSTTQRSTPVDVMGLSSGVTALAVGGSHTCALVSGGSVKCWGQNSQGQLGDGTTDNRTTPVDVTGLTEGVTAITAGIQDTCALISGGGVKCWGANWAGQLGDGTTDNRSTPVDVTGLAEGVAALVAGGVHTCALVLGGGAKCWGWNSSGQLGDGTIDNRTTPVDVTGLTEGVTALVAGEAHTCALVSGSGAKCWGANGSGQLGDSTTDNRTTPVDVTGLTEGVTALAAGGSHTCAFVSGGGIKCWGVNGSGQLGDGTTDNRTTPVDVTGLAAGVTALAAGGSHTCALTAEGSIKCWGSDGSGQLGLGITIQRSTAMDVMGLPGGVTALALGGGYTCALVPGGGVKCWGGNFRGVLGDGTTTQRSKPVDVIGLSSGVTAVSMGGTITCALTAEGGVKCWGWNGYGQLGDGTTDERHTPGDVVGLSSGVRALAVGGWSHTCALITEGGVKCWGGNYFSQLGDGTNDTRTTPVDVVGLSNGVSALAAGMYHTCALTDGGGVKCWGYNDYGQLGDGTNDQHNTPVDVVGLPSGISAVDANFNHSCALTNGGGVKCWGGNYFGQLGDGTTDSRTTPVNVTGLTSGVAALAAGGSHTCVLTTEGGVKCWGYNDRGQLGNGTTTQRLTPVDVVGLSAGVVALAAGYNHTCAMTVGSKVKCWGSDDSGQLGLGTLTQRLTPMDVVDNNPAHISINYTAGQPGSFFTLTGENFPASSTATITVNAEVLTNTLQVNETGTFIVFLDTSGAEAGGYLVTVSVNPSASALFILEETAPLRQQEGGGQTLSVPAGIAALYYLVYLPMIAR